MVWNATLPTNTTKVRNLGIEIRPNWEAIETAGSTFLPQAINFKNRDDGIAPVTPAAIANALIAFSKKDASSVAQLFAINENSEVEQLTGNLSSGTSSGFTHYTYALPGALGIILKVGQCNSNSGAGGANTFATPFPTNCFGVILSVGSSTAVSQSVDDITAAGFTAFNSSGSLTSYFLAWGN